MQEEASRHLCIKFTKSERLLPKYSKFASKLMRYRSLPVRINGTTALGFAKTGCG